MIDDLLLPRVEGVDMSFLLAIGAGVNVSAFAAGDRFLCVDSSDNSSATTDDSDNASDSDDASNSNDDDDDDDDAVPMMPMPKKARRVYVRKPMNNCAWWTAFLSQEAKAILINEPDGKDATSFRRAFRVPYSVFKEKILDFSVQMWWPEWHEFKVDAFGRPVGFLELKLLGCLNTLGMGANHFSVSLQTNISEEVHRTFFMKWIGLMASVKELFIYMPQEEIQLKFVVDEYKAMGLPGCVGSVDCVHIGWDMCPVQYTNMYKGKEGYTSIAYEVICTSRKFIQSVSAGHPGARNDKHIVRTDDSVMSHLEGNGRLNSQ